MERFGRQMRAERNDIRMCQTVNRIYYSLLLFFYFKLILSNFWKRSGRRIGPKDKQGGNGRLHRVSVWGEEERRSSRCSRVHLRRLRRRNKRVRWLVMLWMISNIWKIINNFFFYKKLNRFGLRWDMKRFRLIRCGKTIASCSIKCWIVKSLRATFYLRTTRRQ